MADDTKVGLLDALHGITRVNKKVLTDGMQAHETSVAEKMSWAAGRQTEKIEDKAYSLMGLFGIHMPIIYGEGSKAFRRLQREIMEASTDHSVFAWDGHTSSSGILAESPDQFFHSDLHPCDYEEYIQKFNISRPKPDFAWTNFGLHIQLPISPILEYPGYYYGYLACSPIRETSVETKVVTEKWPAIYLHRESDNRMPRFVRTSFQHCWTGYEPVNDWKYDTNPLYILLYEDIWPLSMPRNMNELPVGSTSATPSSFANSDPEHTITFVLGKTHRNIEIVDTCPGHHSTPSNEFSMQVFPGTWAIRKEFGRITFPNAQYGVWAKILNISRLKYVERQQSRRLFIFIVDGGIVSGRVVMVFAMGKGLWYLFLWEAQDGLDANAYREALTHEGFVPTVPFSASTFLSIPFNLESDDVAARVGSYFIKVKRVTRLGYHNLAFCVTVGLKTYGKALDTPNWENTEKSVGANELTCPELIFDIH